MLELKKARQYKNIAEPILSRALRDIAWLGWTGPSVWEALGKGRIPVYLLHLDTRKVSASRAIKNQDALHDLETVLRGQVSVQWKNHHGLGLLFDERKGSEFELLPYLRENSTFVVGHPGAGKTTLMQHVIAGAGAAWVIDAKQSGPKKWPGADRIIGSNGDYQAIDDALTHLLHRAHQTDGDPLLVVIDDIFKISLIINDVVQRAAQIYAFGRESGLIISILSQTDTVTSLNATGLSALLDGLTRVEVRKMGNRRIVDINLYDGKRRLAHPGPFDWMASEMQFSKAEKALIWIAVNRNRGSFAVNKIDSLAKELAPRLYERELSYSKIADLAADWEGKGLLTPPTRNKAGHPVGRRVTKRLIEISEIGGQ